jgi:hypothetical protein
MSVKAKIDPIDAGPPAIVRSCRSGVRLLRFSCEAALELRNQSRQGFRLLIRCEVTTGQPLNLEAELAQPLLGEVNLPVFETIFVAAADKERELISIGFEETTEVEPIALRFVIGVEARCGSEVEHAIMAV